MTRNTLLAAFLFMVAWPANASEADMAASAFGYALAASGWCDGIMVKASTEAELEKEYGQPMRGDGATLNSAFGMGLERFALEQENAGDTAACAFAYERVGPSGSEYPGLLIDSPFR